MMRSNTGQGMAARTTVDATRPGFGVDDRGGSTGETPGAGSLFSAVLTERPNTSNNRNQGPSRQHSAIGNSTIPIVTSGSRNTGRVR